MNLLAGTLYDPGTAVNKVTTGLLAMTALDTTNLRHTVTVPPSGRILWEIEGTLHGATTMPQIMLGVMEGSTVRGRAAPMHGATNIAATSLVKVSARGIITGLTPGASITLDAAYGVETLLAATGLKYGGPNNTTANDNFGGLYFALLDPSPIYTPSSVPAASVHQKLDTIDTVVDAILVDTDVIGSTGQGLSSLATQASVNAVDTVVDAIKLVTDKLDTALEADAAVYRFTTNALEQAPAGGGGLDAAGVRAAIGLASANLDTQLAAIDAKTTNLPSDPADASIVAAATNAILTAVGDVPTVAEIHAELSELANLDVAVSTRLASAGYTAPNNALIGTIDGKVDAVQAKTDSLNFTVAGKLDANTLLINGVVVQGSGLDGNCWRGT